MMSKKIKLLPFKRAAFFIFFLTMPFLLPAQQQEPFSTYYEQRQSHFSLLPNHRAEVVFLGNSITDGAEWQEMFADKKIINRGISGDYTEGVLNRIDEIVKLRPGKLFLMIGVNDLARGRSASYVVNNILQITTKLKEALPTVEIYVQSILPVNKNYKKFTEHVNKEKEILQINAELQRLAHNYIYINLHSHFTDEAGNLHKNFTNDGLHLNGEAYLLWKHLVYPYIYNATPRAALIPLPREIKYTEDDFLLYKSAGIYTGEAELKKEMLWLQEELRKKGISQDLLQQPVNDKPFIELSIDRVEAQAFEEEAYRLEVSSAKILLKANNSKGIYYGLQTLMQLLRDGVIAEGCTITDWPAFGWRGYMMDVGRNYMSVDLLKKKIDYLSRYKYNIFHFHLTEDIAWRLAIDRYPQLTLPENMLRNKGMYYTEAEMHDLIAYCKERYITLIPEIDMPGHSEAFTRAMGFNMQSDSGLAAVKNILREVISKYDLPYWHIGADEVKITNMNFLPEVSKLVDSFQKRIIGWEPGGNFTKNTIRQLWMDDNGKIASQNNIQYIDSRHLYLNHMDPLEAVTTLFFRQICGIEQGNSNALGGIICTWNDRAAASEEDIMLMNPVYPGMLAFAERVWRGGGKRGWVAVADPSNNTEINAFKEFENRLIDHKRQYFSEEPFPYHKQQQIHWKLYGPYSNKGNVTAMFAPETDKNFDTANYVQTAIGGTIVLRHWWAPQVQGILKKPADSTTWYAATSIWSEEAGIQKFWIGFNNISRSPSTDSPPVAAWDDKGSQLWVNGEIIPPPSWKRGGQQGNSEIPLQDEGYEYRKPTAIYLKKGWNEVLIKAPVGSFKGRNWHNPVKWMFTFLPLKNE